MPDFSKGLIYTIRTGNSIYVGSTTNFNERNTHHNDNLHYKNGSKYHYKVYKTIRENDYKWDMKIYKEFPCENNTQLIIEEERVRCELNADLNMRSCGTGLSKSEYFKKRYTDNKDKIAEQGKQYRIINKDKIAEQGKQYRIINKDKIKEKKQQKITCECGCIILNNHLSRHKRTKKHLKLMKIINSV